MVCVVRRLRHLKQVPIEMLTGDDKWRRTVSHQRRDVFSRQQSYTSRYRCPQPTNTRLQQQLLSRVMAGFAHPLPTQFTGTIHNSCVPVEQVSVYDRHLTHRTDAVENRQAKSARDLRRAVLVESHELEVVGPMRGAQVHLKPISTGRVALTQGSSPHIARLADCVCLARSGEHIRRAKAACWWGKCLIVYYRRSAVRYGRDERGAALFITFRSRSPRGTNKKN